VRKSLVEVVQSVVEAPTVLSEGALDPGGYIHEVECVAPGVASVLLCVDRDVRVIGHSTFLSLV